VLLGSAELIEGMRDMPLRPFMPLSQKPGQHLDSDLAISIASSTNSACSAVK